MTHKERPAVFGPRRSMLGVWCEGSTQTTLPTVLLINSGVIHRVGASRLHVRLARALAERGFPSLRFDLSGIGDSAAPAEAIALREVVAADIRHALDFARARRGVSGAVLAGLCSGARDGLEAAVRDPDVVGLVAIDLIAEMRNWHHRRVHFTGRLFNARSWINTISGQNGRLSALIRAATGASTNGASASAQPPMALGVRDLLPRATLQASLDELLDRGLHALFVFSGGLEGNYNHRNQFAEVFPAVAAHPHLDWRYHGDAGHTFANPEQQAALIDAITTWMADSFDEAASRGDLEETVRGSAS